MTPITVAEAIPKVCTVADLLRILQISRSHLYEQMARGTFPIPELLPRVARGPRFTGEDVERYLANREARR